MVKFEVDTDLIQKYCKCTICGNDEYVSVRTNYRNNHGYIVRMCKECREDMIKFLQEVDENESRNKVC